MKGIQYIIGVLFMLWITPSLATAMVCNSTPSSNKNYSIPPVNITLGSGIADFTLLYSVTNAYTITRNSNVCTAGPRINWVASLTDIAGSSSYDYTFNGIAHKIFPTSISGLGVSFRLITMGFGTPSVPAWPDTAQDYVTSGGGADLGNWFEIYLWKIPGDLPTNTGTLQFTGPTLRFFFTPANAGDTMTSSTLPVYATNYVEWSSLQFIGTANIINGTCDISMANTAVKMGSFDGNGGRSSWVDSSFKLNCPNAYGYGGKVDRPMASSGATDGTRTANSIKNNPIRIQIQPYTPVIDASKGILELDSAGAQGYGLQLAWGDIATLGSGDPANPVQLNTWTMASTLNSAYRSSAYAIGATPLSNGADGTIKMAARYIRTTGTTSGGPANAAVEVLASYE